MLMPTGIEWLFISRKSFFAHQDNNNYNYRNETDYGGTPVSRPPVSCNKNPLCVLRNNQLIFEFN